MKNINREIEEWRRGCSEITKEEGGGKTFFFVFDFGEGDVFESGNNTVGKEILVSR